PDQANAVAADAAGDWVVAGQTRNDYVEYDNWMIRKYTAGGADAWWDEVVGADHWNDEAHAVAVDGDNNVVVAGNVYSDATYDDWLIRKYRPDGTPAWSVLTDDGHAGTDVPYALAIDGGGNVVAGGHFDGEWIVGKYDATGALRWRDRYVNPAGSSSDARGVAVGPTGRLFS